MEACMREMKLCELYPEKLEAVSGGEFSEIERALPLMNDDEMERFDELTAQVRVADAEAKANPSAENATRAFLLVLARNRFCRKVAEYRAAFGAAR